MQCVALDVECSHASRCCTLSPRSSLRQWIKYDLPVPTVPEIINGGGSMLLTCSSTCYKYVAACLGDTGGQQWW